MEGIGGLKDMRVGEKGFVSEAEEQNKALVRRFLEAVQKGDSDTMHELLYPDFVDHSLLPGQRGAVAMSHANFAGITLPRTQANKLRCLRLSESTRFARKQG